MVKAGITSGLNKMCKQKQCVDIHAEEVLRSSTVAP